MTDTDFATIERIATIYGFFSHPATEYVSRHITNKQGVPRSGFHWTESQGFDEFFEDAKNFFHESGYEKASRW